MHLNLNLCLIRFADTRFISQSVLNSAALPLYPDDFEKLVKQKCLEQRELLEKNWIPKCAKLILDLKDHWKHLVPQDDDEALDMPMKFFACIAVEMSNQLRNLVVDSLHEFVDFFEQFKVYKISRFSKNKLVLFWNLFLKMLLTTKYSGLVQMLPYGRHFTACNIDFHVF